MAGCDGGSGDSNLPISSQNLSGKIGGQPWSLATAQSDAFLSDSTQYFVTMYPTAFRLRQQLTFTAHVVAWDGLCSSIHRETATG